MVRNILKIILLTILATTFTSCERLSQTSTIIAGNEKFRSGRYQGAIIDYLKGVDSQTNKDYFYYNLGNVYSSLGEYPAAYSVWNLADGQDNSSLEFSILYNLGYLEYQEGNYEDSYLHYRQALELKPSNINAKINLELSLNKMSAANNNQVTDLADNELLPDGATDETTRILEYVRQKEAMTWGTIHQDQEIENDW